MKEVWKPIKKYEGYYSISNKGRVRRELAASGTKVGRILKPGIDGRGYKFVILCKDKNHKINRVHCMVAQAFIGSRPAKKEINHIDGCKTNNSFNNLEYVTSSENKLHAIKNGLRPQHPFTKINKKIAERIRKEYIPWKNPARVLSKKYGVCDSVIAEIVNNLAWKNI